MNLRALKEQINQWNQRLLELSLRERILVCVTPLLITAGLGLNLLNTTEKQLTQERQQLQQMLHQNKMLSSQLHQLNILAAQGIPDDPQSLKLQQAIVQRQNRIVEPAQMLALLRTLLHQHTKVIIVQLRTGAAEKISQPSQAPLYRLPILLKLRGSYFDLIACLKDLEQSGSFYWIRMHDHIEHYPENQFTIELYLLSRNEVYSGA